MHPTPPSRHRVSALLLAAAGLLCFLAKAPAAQTFNFQVGPQPTPLVNHTDLWHYHKGTNAPGAGWQTAPDASLSPSLWATGNGGIGYSTDTPNEVALCQTLINDMFNGYTTLYARRSFEITQSPNPTLHLQLTIDYDDGFVAYLDGVEVARDRARTAALVEPPFNDTSSSNHESSRGTSTPVNPPSRIDLGPVADRLGPGTHVLAILGLNGAPNSSDFILIPDLALVPGGGFVTGPLLSVVNADSIPISGTSTLPGTAHVRINGTDTDFNPGTGAWSRQQPLAPGCNRLVIDVVSASGATIFSTNHTVVSELATTHLTSLAIDTVLDPSMGVIRITNHLTVPTGGTLTLNPGTVILLGPAINLRATNNSTLTIQGTAGSPVCLFTADGATMWGELAADGADSFLTVHHAETIGGAIKCRNGATGLFEDSYFHDYKNGSVPIGGCTTAHSVTVRRCHFRTYHETLWQNTLMAIEDTLFEWADNASSDALDFDGAVVGSHIRNCTFRHGPQSNTDAIDIGPTTSGSGSTNTIIENCLMFAFPNDKGVSIGEGSYGIVVRNCLMYGNDSGVAVKDSPGGKPPCTAIIYNCTIVDNDWGYRCYNKSNPGAPDNGGQITNSYNNILWNNRFGVFEILNDGIVIADHSDFVSTNWPGTGNFDADPLFVSAAQRDYRLQPGSPCIGSGRDGQNLGAKFPVGAAMAPSHPTFSAIATANGEAHLGFWVDSERDYSVLCSDTPAGGTWTRIADVYHQLVPRFVTVTNSLAAGNRFYQLVSPPLP